MAGVTRRPEASERSSTRPDSHAAATVRPSRLRASEPHGRFGDVTEDDPSRAGLPARHGGAAERRGHDATVGRAGGQRPGRGSGGREGPFDQADLCVLHRPAVGLEARFAREGHDLAGVGQPGVVARAARRAPDEPGGAVGEVVRSNLDGRRRARRDVESDRGFIPDEGGDRRDAVVEAVDAGQLAGAPDIPDEDLAAGGAVRHGRRGEQAAVGGEHEAADRERMALQLGDGGVGPEVPEPDRTALVAAGERPTVGAGGQRPHVALVAVQRDDPGCRVLPEQVPGEVARVVLAGVPQLVVQEVLGPLALPVLDRRAGEAELRGVQVPVGQPPIAIGEVGVAVGAGGLGQELLAVTAEPDRVLEPGRREGDGEQENGHPRDGHQPAVPARPLARTVEQRRPAGADRSVVEETAEVIGELRGRRVAFGGDLGHRLLHDRLELDGDPGVDLARGGRVVLLDPAQHVDAIVAGERGHEGQQLVNRGAQRVHIGAPVEGRPAGPGLFGAHVARGAEGLAGQGQVEAAADPRQAEIRDPDVARLVDQEVRGLDVSMHDLVGVGVFQADGDVAGESCDVAFERRAVVE